MMKREKANYAIQSVAHALDILESFTRTEDEHGVTDLSKKLGLHKNNVFRLLATLEHRGYIEQNLATESYRLGPKTLQLGAIFIEQRECRRQARPVLEDLMTRSGETAFVAVLRGDQVITMDSVEPARTVRAASRIGTMYPAHATAVGKVLLSSLSPAVIEHLYPGPDLPALTEKTIRTRHLLQADLKRTFDLGYGFEDGEFDADVRSIAAPVMDISRTVIAAVGIVAPAHRFTDELLESGGVIGLVREAGHSISVKMGFISPAGGR